MQKSQSKEGLVIERRLKSCGISQASLARTLGVSPQVITGWVKRGVSAKSASDLSEILGVEPHEVCAAIKESHPVDQGLPIAQQKFLELRRQLGQDLLRKITSINDPDDLLRASKILDLLPDQDKH